MNTRRRQAKQILTPQNMIEKTSPDTFKVKSMMILDKYYTVSRTGSGLVCECSDPQHHKSNCKHIKLILEIIKQNKSFVNNEFKIVERVNLGLCKYCISDNTRKREFSTNKRGGHRALLQMPNMLTFWGV